MKQYFKPQIPLGEDKLLPHTGLAEGQSAPYVLLPGDPHRSKLISTFFRDAEFTAHRGTYATFTGHTENGTEIGVTSSGMGCSCVVSALEELAQAGATSIVRVGTCGGVQPWMQPGRIVIASGCVRGEGASYEMVPPEFPAVADPLLVSALVQAAREMGEDPLVGMYRSHDAFYIESKAAHPGLRDRMQKWIDTGVLVVENESGMLFTYGHLLGLRTATICVALGSMFADASVEAPDTYGAYNDPDFLKKRIEVASRIAIRAAEILKEAE